jgi:hypothetical protein
VELGDQLVVVVEDLAALHRLEVLERGDRGQGAGEDGEGPEGGHSDPEAAQEEHDHQGEYEGTDPAASYPGEPLPAWGRGHIVGIIQA